MQRLIPLGSAFVLALVIAGSIAFLLSRSGRRGEDPGPAGGPPAVRADLERRLAALEARLERDPAPEAPEEEAEGRAAPAGEEGDPATSSLEERVRKLEARVAALGTHVKSIDEDPVRRSALYLASPSPKLRREGIKMLRKLARSDPEARQALLEMLADPDPDIRREAIDAAADLKDAEAASAIAALFSDQDPRVRADAIQAAAKMLGKLAINDNGTAAASLAQHLADPDAEVRRRAAGALGDLKARGSMPSLLKLLEDPEGRVREEAIASLGKIGDPSAAAALKAMYRPGAGRESLEIAAALKQLGDTGPLLEEIRRLGREAIESTAEETRREAIRGLSRHARAESREIFTKALEDPSPRVRKEAEDAMKKLPEAVGGR